MSDTNHSRSGFSVLKVLAVIGIVFIALVGGCVACTAGAVGAVANAQKQAEAKQVTGAKELMTTTVSDLRPDGELALVFTMGSKHTDLQRAEWEKRITGQVVDWTLPIYEVRKEKDHYVVQTNASVMEKGPVGCFIDIYPQSEQDVAILAALQLKSPIHFRGRIVGTTLRNLKITPAILVAEAKAAPAPVPAATP